MSPARAARMAARPAPRRAYVDDVPALRLVDPAARQYRRALTRAVTILATALAGAGLFGVVGLHVLLTQGQAELDSLHTRADSEAARNGRLTVQVAQLEAPARVVEAARQRLGMVPLAAVVYLPARDPASPLPPVPDGPPPTTPTSPASGAPRGTAGAPKAAAVNRTTPTKAVPPTTATASARRTRSSGAQATARP